MVDKGTTNTSNKRAFVSYSQLDQPFTDSLTAALMKQGQDVFYDKWDILPGDSLIEKIFEEGLSTCSAFIIVLSNNSIKSSWVKEELNAATLRRIEKHTKIIPVLIEDVDLPLVLRTLAWVDMRTEFDVGVRKIINSIHGISEKPPLGVLSGHLKNLPDSVGDLSKVATALALKILELSDPDSEKVNDFKNTMLSEELSLSSEELNDAVDELEDNGIIKTMKYLGTAPYAFGSVVPTYLIYHEFIDYLNYDPKKDIKTVASAIAALEETDGKQLTETTKLSYGRLNRAVEYLKDYGIIKTRDYLGSYPYLFGHAMATRKTRQFVSSGG